MLSYRKLLSKDNSTDFTLPLGFSNCIWFRAISWCSPCFSTRWWRGSGFDVWQVTIDRTFLPLAPRTFDDAPRLIVFSAGALLIWSDRVSDVGTDSGTIAEGVLTSTLIGSDALSVPGNRRRAVPDCHATRDYPCFSWSGGGVSASRLVTDTRPPRHRACRHRRRSVSLQDSRKLAQTCSSCSSLPRSPVRTQVRRPFRKLYVLYEKLISPSHTRAHLHKQRVDQEQANWLDDARVQSFLYRKFEKCIKKWKTHSP